MRAIFEIEEPNPSKNISKCQSKSVVETGSKKSSNELEEEEKLGKHSTPFQKNEKRWPLMILLSLSLSTAIVFIIKSSSSDSPLENQISVSNQVVANPFGFMKSKLVLLVSHELSLSGLKCLRYVVHIGNSKELMEVAENSLAKRVRRSMSGNSLECRMKICSLQSSIARGECFGRITIEAMAFQLHGTAAGGTMEIEVNGTTVWLHPDGKEGVTPLVENIVKMATHVERQLTMGKKGYERVKERFLEHHMSQRIALVLKEVLRMSNSNS
ncbi:hypothetical protein Vadar_024475 [Vaccinium darrowii]|uniref:Uncharacterized protein n=1 Tax=Vaccinium darrowii TaxID=229202 RepID=A0ACB7Y2A4_9ERIC|nr:hypothetical protein Vadar_024475 [Vaccinium darrowii]